MVAFEWRFSTLSIFIHRVELLEEEMTHMFEEKIHPRYRDLVLV